MMHNDQAKQLVLKTVRTSGIALSTLILGVGSAWAHVVVTPAQVGVAAEQTFTMGVPSEKPMATTSVRLVIPSGVTDVMPNVKPGWQIDEKKTGGGDNATVSEITWSGGQIPAEFRDEFSFSAQVPSSATTLAWKAYQTYADGSVIAWDETPTTDAKNPPENPYSQTKVVNDLASDSTSARTNAALAISLAALGLAAVTLFRRK